MKAFELTPLMLRLLKQAWSDGHIYPSDYMDRRLGEVAALREMAKHGFVQVSEEDPRLPGPPVPPRWFITDKGLEAASSALNAGSEGEPFMMLSCREAKQCLHNIPGCICDGDPTNG